MISKRTMLHSRMYSGCHIDIFASFLFLSGRSHIKTEFILFTSNNFDELFPRPFISIAPSTHTHTQNRLAAYVGKKQKKNMCVCVCVYSMYLENFPSYRKCCHLIWCLRGWVKNPRSKQQTRTHTPNPVWMWAKAECAGERSTENWNSRRRNDGKRNCCAWLCQAAISALPCKSIVFYVEFLLLHMFIVAVSVCRRS